MQRDCLLACTIHSVWKCKRLLVNSHESPNGPYIYTTERYKYIYARVVQEVIMWWRLLRHFV